MPVSQNTARGSGPQGDAAGADPRRQGPGDRHRGRPPEQRHEGDEALAPRVADQLGGPDGEDLLAELTAGTPADDLTLLVDRDGDGFFVDVQAVLIDDLA